MDGTLQGFIGIGIMLFLILVGSGIANYLSNEKVNEEDDEVEDDESEEGEFEITLSGRQKHSLELNYPGDSRLFLNFWDWAHGNDVVCEVIGGELIDSNEEQITFQEFLRRVEQSITSRRL